MTFYEIIRNFTDSKSYNKYERNFSNKTRNKIAQKMLECEEFFWFYLFLREKPKKLRAYYINIGADKGYLCGYEFSYDEISFLMLEHIDTIKKLEKKAIDKIKKNKGEIYDNITIE